MKTFGLLAAAAMSLLATNAQAVVPTTPSVSIAFNVGSVQQGKKATLHWHTTDVSSCVASGGWSGTQATSGSEVEVGDVVGDTTYTLTCSGTDGGTTASATLHVTPPPPTIHLLMGPSSIVLGHTATLHWSTKNANSCVASGDWSGVQATSGSQTEKPVGAGTTTYTLSCSGDGGDVSATATLQTTPPVPTVKLSVAPGSIVLGKRATLRWSSTNATSCVASGAWNGTQTTSGTQIEQPSTVGNDSYVLTCSGAGGSGSAVATLSVTSSATPAPTVTITASPSSVAVGGSSTLSWSSTDATSCTASGAWSGSQATSGSIAANTASAGSSVYTLSCTGAGGTASNSATLTVNAAPTVTISLNPTSVATGQSSALTWSSTNASSCTASGSWSGSEPTSGSASVSGNVAGSRVYTLSCTGAGGTTSNSATLTVSAIPTVTIAVSPTTVTVGQSSTLSWSSTNADNCTASDAWSGPQATSGSLAANTATAGVSTYTLSCTGAGGTVSNSASLTVNAAQLLVSSLDTGVSPSAVTINQGTAIGQGSLNGATPFTLTNLAADTNNTQTVTSNINPFESQGTVPDTAAGFCNYSGASPKRVSYITGTKFATKAAGSTGGDPSVAMAPFYFPLTYYTKNTTTGNAFGGKAPIIGLFDWRPKDIDEALVAAESDDNGKTWYFMQTVLELNPDFTNPIISGSNSTTATDTGCPPTIGSTNIAKSSVNGTVGDDGWGHASIIQLPGLTAASGQFLYMLDRNGTTIQSGATAAPIDNAPLWVINLASPNGVNGGSSNKFPIWNSNNTGAGANDIKSISLALNNSAGAAAAGNTVLVKQTSGLLNPDGIMAVFPTAPTAAVGSPVTVMYVQKVLSGDNTGSTALPTAQRCGKAPFSGKTNHDIANVRLATTTDGINFTDIGIVNGLNDPTTVDFNKTRWVSPRGTLIDINGDGSRWGLYFSAGNCLDGDSDAFHYIGYAESSDMVNWTVYNDINSPIASINTITVNNPATGTVVTIPANAPVVPTQPWFAQRIYAPSATQIDPTHLSMTFAGYGVQTPSANLLNYRQIGNVVLTLNKALPAGVPNNINAH